MEFAFENRSIRDICEDEEIAQDKYGEEIAKKLKTRLAELRAARTVNELIVGQPGMVGDNKSLLYSINLNEGLRVIFCASDLTIPYAKDGIVDWSKVRRIKILEIENTNV